MTKAQAIERAKKWTKANDTGAFVYRDGDNYQGYAVVSQEEYYGYFNVPEEWVTEYVFAGEIEEVY